MNRETWVYIFAVVCLGTMFYFQSARTQDEVMLALDRMDRNLCNSINRMHTLRGLSVMDCEQGKVRIQALNEDGVRVLAEYVDAGKLKVIPTEAQHADEPDQQ